MSEVSWEIAPPLSMQDMQAWLQENRSTSMLKTDPIIGDVLRGTKPVVEPMPEVKPLPDGLRYNLDVLHTPRPVLLNLRVRERLN